MSLLSLFFPFNAFIDDNLCPELEEIYILCRLFYVKEDKDNFFSCCQV